MEPIPKSQLHIRLDEPARGLEEQWRKAVASLPEKIIVLDDDPTGVQTVHGVPVYTSWEEEDCRQMLAERGKVVFLLTNSRAVSQEESIQMHRQIGENLDKARRSAGLEKGDMMLVLRGDSTLRGHYPEEINAIEEVFYGGMADGEVHIPAFFEGGRYTLYGTHYVGQGELLVPAGETEFAKDPLFAYSSSRLDEWIGEKSGRPYQAEDFVYMDIDLLRQGDIGKIVDRIMRGKKGAKIIVDAADDWDIRQFAIGLAECVKAGRRYIFRTAASAIGALGGILKRPLLRPEEINPTGRAGLIVVGSFVNKTSRQLAALQEEQDIFFYEAEVARILSGDLEKEAARAAARLDGAMEKGRTACLYTSRGYYGSGLSDEEKIENSKRISAFLVEVVKSLSQEPGYMIAKGGITSSDIGVKGLGARRATVAGQAAAGVPVWATGEESRFPGMGYVIFPGNVGEDTALRDLVRELNRNK